MLQTLSSGFPSDVLRWCAITQTARDVPPHFGCKNIFSSNYTPFSVMQIVKCHKFTLNMNTGVPREKLALSGVPKSVKVSEPLY